MLRLNHDVQFSQHSLFDTQTLPASGFGGQARIRTLEDISQQIYSLPPLATWVPAQTYARDFVETKNHHDLLLVILAKQE